MLELDIGAWNWQVLLLNLVKSMLELFENFHGSHIL